MARPWGTKGVVFIRHASLQLDLETANMGMGSRVGCFYWSISEVSSMKWFSKSQAKGFTISSLGFLAEWLLYLLLAMAATRPLPRWWTTAIPQGTENAATVPLFNLWTLGWNVSRVETGLRGYWEAPIFHPAHDAFAFSEPQPLLLLMAPVLWCGGTLAAAYNLSLWLGLSLTGVVTSRLLLRWTGSWFAAWTGGAMMLMLPYVHWQLGVLQLVPLFGVIWTIAALAKFGEEASIQRSLILGTAFALAYILCNYHGLFLSLLLILSGGWLLGRNFWNWRTWAKLVPGALWCLVLIGPMAIHQLHVSKQHDWSRPAELIQQQSAQWGDFTATPWPQLLPIREFVDPDRSGWMLSPGYLKMILAICGLAWGLYSRRLRRFALFLAMFVACSYLLTLGPNFHVGTGTPYDWLREHYPGLNMARNVFRFVVFAQIGIVLLAAIGLDGLWNRPWFFIEAGIGFVAALRRNGIRKLLRAKWESGDDRNLSPSIPAEAASPKRFLLLLGVGFLAIIEVWPAPQKLFTLPDYEKERGWLNWVEQNTETNDPLACVPFPKGTNADAYFGTTVWMYYALEHRRPILNGYSGFFPEQFLNLKEAMARFPDANSLKLLEESGARYCVVFRGSISPSAITQHPIARQKLKWRFGDDKAQIDIYEFLPRSG